MKYKYRGWFGRRARRRCPHTVLQALHGDHILWSGGWRLECLNCGRFLDGPYTLAYTRNEE